MICHRVLLLISRNVDSASSILVSKPTPPLVPFLLPSCFSIESSLRSISFNRYCNSDFADDVRHVNAAVNAMPPMNNDSGRSVESLMMPELDCDATPTPARAMPEDVQTNCEILSIEL